MDVVELELAGAMRLTPKRFTDDRGYFSETFNARALSALGISEPSKGISADLPRLMIQKEVIDAESEPVDADTELPLLTTKGD